MATKPSYSVAPGDAGRSRILSKGALVGIAAFALGALVLVFPKRDLLSLLRDESDQAGKTAQSAQINRELTVAYLQNIIRTEPKDLALRLLLVEKLLEAGQLDAARAALTDSLPLAKTTPAGQDSWDGWDLAWWQARLRTAQAANNVDQALQASRELMARLTRRVAAANTGAKIFAAISAARELSASATTDAALATQAQAIQDQLLTRLLTLPSATPADLSKAASMALADGRFEPASALFFAARRKTTAPDARYKLLQQGVQTLLAAGQSKAAWQAAVRESQPLPEGDPSHWWLSALALGAGEPKEAALALRHVVLPTATPAELAKALSAEQLQLVWATFAAAADLPDALKIVDAALLAHPSGREHAVWLERKAQASEWSGMAPQALKAWLELLRQGAGTRALDNVFRLSPLLYDDDALLAAWLAVIRQRALSAEEADKVIAVYERIGSVERALAFVRSMRRTGDSAIHNTPTGPQWASLEAALLERAGRPDEAITLLEALRPTGLSRPDAVRLATLYLRKGQLPPALRALLAARADTPATGQPFPQAYWELLADVAYDAGQQAVAESALDVLLAQGQPESYHVERAIRLRLTDGSDPAVATPQAAARNAEALRLAARYYARFADDNLAFAWMDAVAAPKIPTGLPALLAGLKPEHRQLLEKNPDFLARRAGVYARLGSPADVALARQDYTASLTLRADHTPTRTAYWWLLIDQQDLRTLRREVAQVERSTLRNPAYAEVLSSVWQVLDEPLRALALMQPLSRTRGNDFLWLMTYADVLDRAGRLPQALRVRRHAWGLLGQQSTTASAAPLQADRARQALLNQIRLASEFAGGEDKTRLWRALGRVLTNAPDAVQKREANEMVGAWLLSEQRFDTAERWLWQQHAARMATPAYQAMNLAVATNDKNAMARLLEEAAAGNGSPLAPQDRVTALRQLARRNEAATVGMELAQRSPEGPTDDTQQALQEDLLATASRASINTVTRQAGVLKRRETVADAAIFIAPHLKLTAQLSSGAYRSTDTAVIAATPAQDREARLGFEAATPWGDVKAEALVRQALASVNGLYLQLTRKLTERSTLQLTLARGERSDESSAMSAVGLRDRATASFSLRAGDRLDGQLSLGTSALRTQTGAALGGSVDAAASGNWTLRRDYPDVRLQTQLRRSVVRADGQPDAATALLQPGGGVPNVGLFLGPSSTAFSASVGVGLSQSDASVYSRAWRPWGEVGFETRLTSGSKQTQGLLRLGAKGSVLGQDQLSINFDVRPGTGGLSGADGSRELRLRYERWFDR